MELYSTVKKKNEEEETLSASPPSQKTKKPTKQKNRVIEDASSVQCFDISKVAELQTDLEQVVNLRGISVGSVRHRLLLASPVCRQQTH